MAEYTKNYKLEKQQGNDYISIDGLNENFEIIDSVIKDAKDKAEQAFQSASNGKAAIKAAITGIDPNVTIPNNATFDQLADAIGQIQTGVDTEDATATAEQILEGMTAYAKGIKVIGTMPKRTGAENVATYRKSSLTGKFYLKPPEGYYDGTAEVNHTDANFIPDNIKEGISLLGVTGIAKTVTPCAQVTNFTVEVGFSTYGQLTAKWTNPTDGKFKGVRVLYKTGSYPTGVNDGIVLYDNNGSDTVANTATVTNLVEGTTYYVRAFAYTYQNATRLYNTETVGAQGYGAPYRTQGSLIYTSSGIFNVPARVNLVQVFLVGGGGGGGAMPSNVSGGTAPGGGGGGYTATYWVSVTPGQQISVIVGAGGTGAIPIHTNAGDTIGGDGGYSYFGSYAAAGGKAGSYNLIDGSSNGGSGGAPSASSSGNKNANGGSDGSNASNAYYNEYRGIYCGYGQGSTTRAWGLAGETLYSGGGGQGGSYPTSSGVGDRAPGNGGEGGGGNGGYSRKGTDGLANTGGGGGGGNTVSSSVDTRNPGGNGGSGIVLVRWGY